MNPRNILSTYGDDAKQQALGNLSWPLIRDRINVLDGEATGGVSPDATLIASLVHRCVRLNHHGDYLASGFGEVEHD